MIKVLTFEHHEVFEMSMFSIRSLIFEWAFWNPPTVIYIFIGLQHWKYVACCSTIFLHARRQYAKCPEINV
jgi:hypothetical protein